MKNIYALLYFFCIASASAQNISFPDANLKVKLLEANTGNGIARDENQNYITIDTNSDGEIQLGEALAVYHLYVDYANISNLSGIENFTTLRTLACGSNQLSSIDVSALTALEYLDCGWNALTNIDVSGMPSLAYLYCNNNNLGSLSVTGCTAMQHLECSFNQLAALDLSGLQGMTELITDNNSLTALDVSGSPLLEVLQCENNQIASLNITGCSAIQLLTCTSNQLTLLDLSGCHPELTYCSYNNITTLIVKNGYYELDGLIEFFENPIQYLCVDDNEITGYQEVLDFYGMPNVSLNTYCSFVPGGTYYTVQGQASFDTGNDGCDASDPAFPFMKFTINSGASGTIVANSSGSYSIALPEGSYTIAPRFEVPEYYNVSPQSVSAVFPGTQSPAEQQFCIAPNGAHNDLEVTLIPVEPSMPGYDSRFIIFYKNKGNQVASGDVTLSFEDEVMDAASSNPAAVQSGGLLSWTFTGLYPSESREIEVVFNVNTPTDEPPVEIEDQFDFTATITSAAADDLPDDNTDTLNQIVIGSFDPNDITCLEGRFVSPDIAGKYVHYMIRFENTGTAAARNIVVKDVIDAAKLDISTLIPETGSHPFTTRINGNTAEFIFENINLPFANNENDGFLMFKARVRPTVAVGNTIANSASIYFDYNLPVDTEPALTTIQVLATQTFAESDFNIYPVPATNMLYIKPAGSKTAQAIEVYNTEGRLLISIPDMAAMPGVDVSALGTGTYIIRIKSEKNYSSCSFIKQ